MPTSKRIEQDLRPHGGVEWVTALRARQIQTLAVDGVLQLSLFDKRELAEIYALERSKRGSRRGVPVSGQRGSSREGGGARHSASGRRCVRQRRRSCWLAPAARRLLAYKSL